MRKYLSEGTIKTIIETSTAKSGKLIKKATSVGGRLIDKLLNFIGEGSQDYHEDGLIYVFGKMNQPELLDNLRKATKGTVNDFDLMKAAVQAKDFRIPLKDLGTYLQFAQLKAQHTGQSVGYMIRSIVLGLGYKSKMFLDDLGISAAEIDEKVAKTGDFTKAVAEIVSNQMK